MTDNTLALYIHWPFCKAKCPYCDFNSHVRESVWMTLPGGARSAVRWRIWQPTRRCKQVSSIFFGGGTPSLMQPATVEALIMQADRLYGAWAMPTPKSRWKPTRLRWKPGPGGWPISGRRG